MSKDLEEITVDIEKNLIHLLTLGTKAGVEKNLLNKSYLNDLNKSSKEFKNRKFSELKIKKILFSFRSFAIKRRLSQ